MNLSPRHLINILEKNGFKFRRSKGSHHIYYNPTSKKRAVVPVHGNRDLKKGSFLAVLKQAGIEKTDD